MFAIFERIFYFCLCQSFNGLTSVMIAYLLQGVNQKISLLKILEADLIWKEH